MQRLPETDLLHLPALMLTSFIYIIGCILMTVAGVGGANASALLLAGRVVSGWAVGASSMLAPVFVAESSPPHLRGRLVGCYEIGVQAGTCLGFWIPVSLVGLSDRRSKTLTSTSCHSTSRLSTSKTLSHGACR